MSTPVRRALYGKLAADTTLRGILGGTAAAAPGFTNPIYHGVAPAGAHYPAVVFQQVSGVPTYAMTQLQATPQTYPIRTEPAYEVEVWQVKVVDDEPTADNAEQASARVFRLLNNWGGATYPTLGTSYEFSAGGTIGGTILHVERDSTIAFEEDINGRKYHHVGGNYRVMYQAGTV